MKIIRSIKSLRRVLSAAKAPVGFVPTMGYFHEGHVSLMRRAREENAFVVVSLFVNPIQFAPGEDLARYPRDLKRDQRLAAAAGVDILFVPSAQEMYPDGRPMVSLRVTGLSDGLCGASRPGHFDGVATVVAKLLNIVSPSVMYLGQKDLQQVAVIERLVKDLDMGVRIAVCPTVREPDGLAMSSRNAYLSPSERREAPALYRALHAARRELARDGADAAKIISQIKKLILEETGASIDYVSLVRASDLAPLRRPEGKVVIAAAIRFASARLIDNVVVKVPVK